MQPMFAERTASGPGCRQRFELPRPQLLRQFGLQQRVGARRAAAQVGLRDRHDLRAQRDQQRLDRAADPLPMLQRARRVEREALASGRRHLLLQPGHVVGQPLGEVARRLAHALCLRRVTGVLAQQVPVLLDHAAAARGVEDDRFRTAFQLRPPRVDVPPRIVARAIKVVEMVADGTAAAGAGGHERLDAERIEHPRGRRVDVRLHGRLHAAGQQQHLARVPS